MCSFISPALPVPWQEQILTSGVGWSSSSESDMLERSVAPQSSRPSQIATEWAETGQAEGNKTSETSENCNATLNVSYFIYVSIVNNVPGCHCETSNPSSVHSKIQKKCVCVSNSLLRGEWTTGAERAGLVCMDSSPRYLLEQLIAEELWGTGRHAEQPPTDAPPHDTHISDALKRITKGTRHDHNKQDEQQQHPRCHKTSSSTFWKWKQHSIKFTVTYISASDPKGCLS